MKNTHKTYLSLLAFTAYAAWGSYHLGVCASGAPEGCISAFWWLFDTGLPSSLVSTLWKIDSELIEVAALTLIGGVQWAAVCYLILSLGGAAFRRLKG